MYTSLFYRCRSLKVADSNSTIPALCDVFDNYVSNSDFGYYDEDTPPGIQQALDDVLLILQWNMSRNLSQCVQLVGDYLCLYYYPICSINDNSIIPVCRPTCNLLFNNEQCSSLLLTAISLIAEQNITLLPDDSCIAHRSFTVSDQPKVSKTCLHIEG